MALCFLGFVAVAGATAAITVAVTTGLPQLVPSILAILATTISHSALLNDQVDGLTVMGDPEANEFCVID